jgi:DNA-binding NtrC family response regulator
MAKEIKAKSVLVVDDDEALTRTIANLLRIEGYEVSTAYNGIQGYASFFRQPAEFVITDIQMPEWDGFEMIRSIRALSPAVKAVYISGAVDTYRAALEEQLVETKPVILEKPFTRNELLALLSEKSIAGRDVSEHDQDSDAVRETIRG